MDYVQKVRHSDQWPHSKKDALDQIKGWQQRCRDRIEETGCTYEEASQKEWTAVKTDHAILHLYASIVALIQQTITEVVGECTPELHTQAYIIFRLALVHYDVDKAKLTTFMVHSVRNRMRNYLRDTGRSKKGEIALHTIAPPHAAVQNTPINIDKAAEKVIQKAPAEDRQGLKQLWKKLNGKK